MATNKLRVYLCGGTGANIGRKLKPGICASVTVDTSVSNTRGISKENVFLVEGMDGSGKKQSVTYQNFKPIAKDVLIKHKPSDELNVVLSSTSGGSGSVMAPMIASALIEAGKNVICVGIESTTSLIETRNALTTLRNYKGVSTALKKCVTLYYIDSASKAEADDRAIWLIDLLALLIDKSRIDELDISDIANFINFNVVTAHEPNVSILEIRENTAYIPEKNTAVVATIHVSTDPQSTIDAPTPDYLAKCLIVDEGVSSSLGNFRIDNVLGLHAAHYEKLSGIIRTCEEDRVVNKIADIGTVSGTSDGMSFD